MALLNQVTGHHGSARCTVAHHAVYRHGGIIEVHADHGLGLADQQLHIIAAHLAQQDQRIHLAAPEEIWQGHALLHLAGKQLQQAEMPRLRQRLHQAFIHHRIEGIIGEILVGYDNAHVQTLFHIRLPGVGITVSQLLRQADDPLSHFLAHAGFTRQRL